MRRNVRLIVFVLIGFIWMAPTCWAQETGVTEEIIAQQMNLLDWGAVEEVEKSLKEMSPATQAFDLKEEVRKLVTGEERFGFDTIGQIIAESFLAEGETYLRLLARFLLIALMCSLLKVLTSAFKARETTSIAFMVTYMMIMLIVSQSLFVVVDLAKETVGHMSQMMLATLPTLLAFMAISGYITSSSALATVLVSTINIMTAVVNLFVIPSVIGLIVLQIVGTMTDEIKVDKFVELFYKCAKWVLRGVFVISLGMMSAYKLTLPYIDVALKKSALSLGSAFMPVVGDASRGALEFVLVCGQLVKNAFAIGIVVWIVIVASGPLIQLVCYTFLYNLVGAVIQPIADKKMVQITNILAKGCEFILSCTTTVVLLAIVAMIVCASVGTSIT